MHGDDGILVVDILGDAEPALERVPEQLQDSIALAWNSRWTRREYAEFR
jgi:hypothetical protein